MKKSILLLFFGLIYLNLVSQTPMGFNYQAVAHDAAGNVLVSKPVAFRISILAGSETGSAVYTEVHKVTTNSFGLVDFVIGNGSSKTGSFETIDWSLNKYFVKIELDPAGGTNYLPMGTSQLMSVPYALHAKTVEVDKVDDADADPANEIQTISKTGITVTLSKGGGSFTDADADSTNEIQTLSINGSGLSLSKNGGTVNLSSMADNWGSQTVATDATLSGNGTTATPLKIAQQAASNGQVLKWNGTTWAPGNVASGNSLSSGDSLVLKDSQGVTRMVMNPNTGTFKMMNKDTVWYSINVNSPPIKTTKNRYFIKEEYGNGDYKIFTNNAEKELVEEQTTSVTSENDDRKREIKTTTKKYLGGELFEKIETSIIEERDFDDFEETSNSTVTFDRNGKIKSVSSYSYEEVNKVPKKIIETTLFDENGKEKSTSKVVQGLDKETKTFSDPVNNKESTTELSTESCSFKPAGNENALCFGKAEGEWDGCYMGLKDGDAIDQLIQIFQDKDWGTWGEFDMDRLLLDMAIACITGNFQVNGNLMVLGIKNFRIDHPDDPRNKYLQHASIESNEVLNKYRGNITTNENGEAIVALPGYFEKINTDFSYQLTVIGAFAQAIIANKIEDNQFTIKTDKPNIEVSWEVTAKRNDKYMIDNPFNDIIDKDKLAPGMDYHRE